MSAATPSFGLLLLTCAACSSPASLAMTDARPSTDARVEDASIASDANLSFADCQAALIVPPASLELSPFYSKYLDVGGLPLLGSSQVRDAAFPVACDILVHMLSKRPDVLAALIDNHIRVGIMAQSEVTTDMPEHADLYEAFPGTDWDTRARGLGATIARPLSSVGEENLLGLPGDPYAAENILVHEFGHTFFDTGAAFLGDGAARAVELSALYNAALAAGTFDNTYAAGNESEYWAEGLQSFYDVNAEAVPADGIHNAINTREELRAADPGLSDFIEVYFAADSYRP